MLAEEEIKLALNEVTKDDPAGVAYPGGFLYLQAGMHQKVSPTLMGKVRTAVFDFLRKEMLAENGYVIQVGGMMKEGSNDLSYVRFKLRHKQ